MKAFKDQESVLRELSRDLKWRRDSMLHSYERVRVADDRGDRQLARVIAQSIATECALLEGFIRRACVLYCNHVEARSLPFSILNEFFQAAMATRLQDSYKGEADDKQATVVRFLLARPETCVRLPPRLIDEKVVNKERTNILSDVETYLRERGVIALKGGVVSYNAPVLRQIYRIRCNVAHGNDDPAGDPTLTLESYMNYHKLMKTAIGEVRDAVQESVYGKRYLTKSHTAWPQKFAALVK